MHVRAQDPSKEHSALEPSLTTEAQTPWQVETDDPVTKQCVRVNTHNSMFMKK